MKLTRRNVLAASALVAGSASFLLGLERGVENLAQNTAAVVAEEPEENQDTTNSSNTLTRQMLGCFIFAAGFVRIADKQRVQQVKLDRAEEAQQIEEITFKYEAIIISPRFEEIVQEAINRHRANSVETEEYSGEQLADVILLRPPVDLEPDFDGTPMAS